MKVSRVLRGIPSKGFLAAFPVCLLVLVATIAGCRQGEVGSALPGKLSFHLFQTDKPVHIAETPEQVKLFDPAVLPSDYETAYVETSTCQHLKILRPYEGASYPCNLAPPLIRWEDSIDNAWMVSIALPGGDCLIRALTRTKSWRPDTRAWHLISKRCKGKQFLIEVRGCRAKQGQRVSEKVYFDRVRVYLSEYPTDPVIVYRLVTPLFHACKTPDIWYRRVSTFEKGLFLPGKGTYCTNCHVFPKGPGVDERASQVAIAVRDQLDPRDRRRVLGLYNFSSRQGRTLNINSFFMGWSPDGQKVAVTHGHIVLVRAPITLETQQFFVQIADICIVDTRDFSVRPLPGACEQKYMENFPTWSPDGKTIVFSRAEEIPPASAAVPKRRFNLYRIPYNDGAGGTPVPIPGASFNEKSNFAARYSPNGRWVVFNMADNASLVEPTSDLYILDASNRDALPRKLECNCDHAMDSHHSWSSNGRWLLFATKRDDGIFARIYITAIDEQGNASPPVTLPIEREPVMCFNVPEFFAYDGDIDGKSILEETTRKTMMGWMPR